MGRATQGVRVMNLDSGERLVSMARLAERDEDEVSLEGEEPTDREVSKGNGAESVSNETESDLTDGEEGA
jgi:DNA gyrase subunit A